NAASCPRHKGRRMLARPTNPTSRARRPEVSHGAATRFRPGHIAPSSLVLARHPWRDPRFRSIFPGPAPPEGGQRLEETDARGFHGPPRDAHTRAARNGPDKILRWMGTEAEVTPQPSGIYL